MSAEQPLVSVVIAVQNGERYLSLAIESVLAQNYQAFEIIVIDGRSTDRTQQVAKSYPRVRYVRQAGKDLPDAYNTGIDSARGELIAFLSHDDLWLPRKLSRQVECFSNQAEVQYAVTQFKYFLEPGHLLPLGFRPELVGRPLVGRIMETLVARRLLFDRIGKLSGEFAIAHDVDWFARAKDQAIPMAVIPEVLLFKRLHDSNLTHTAKLINQELLQALRMSVLRQRFQSPAQD